MTSLEKPLPKYDTLDRVNRYLDISAKFFIFNNWYRNLEFMTVMRRHIKVYCFQMS